MTARGMRARIARSSESPSVESRATVAAPDVAPRLCARPFNFVAGAACLPIGGTEVVFDGRGGRGFRGKQATV
jgi:hypothetical protein